MMRSPHVATVRALAAMGLLLAASTAMAQGAQIVLRPGVAETISIPGSSLTSSYVVDTSAGDATLSIDASAGSDVDVLVRFGTPFQGLSAPISFDYLLEQAHYRGISPGNSERIVIGPAAWQPVRPGRWYLVIANFGSAATTATVTAGTFSTPPANVPITVALDDPSGNCDISGWTNATARGPQGGNSGANLGQLRTNAIREAVRRVQLELATPAPLRVQACWSNLGTPSNTGFTLAQAGPRFVFRNSVDFVTSGGRQVVNLTQRMPWLNRTHTWYPGSIGARLAGTSSCGVTGGDAGGNCGYDVRITFNSELDSGQGSPARNFWYGFSAQNPGPGPSLGADADFVSVAMHELLHGLGFISLISLSGTNGFGQPAPIGSKLDGFDDIFSSRVAWVPEGTTSVVPFPLASDAERVSALTSISQLRFVDDASAASPFNPFAPQPAPDNLVRLNAPTTIQPGSSLSHITASTAGAGLMLPNIVNGLRQLDVAKPMLESIGWSQAPVAAPARIRPRHWQYVAEGIPGSSLNFGYVTTLPDGTDIYYAILFTYAGDGQPEWYLTAGPIVDGVFMPANNANGDSLPRPRADPATFSSPPDPSIRGQIRLDFNQPGVHPACAGRTNAAAVMAWSIGSDNDIKWCMSEILPTLTAPPVNLTGIWGTVGPVNGNPDFGWGLDVLSFTIGGNPAIFGVVYYPDASGSARWAFFSSGNYQPGVELDLLDRVSGCRTCPLPPNEPTVTAGTIRVDLRQPLQGQASVAAGNRVRFSVTYPRAPGGTFTRDVPVGLQSSPVAPAP